MNPGLNFLCVGLGGALGACLRYGVSLSVSKELIRFPLATLSVNILGALLAGIIATAFWYRDMNGTSLQLMLVVGFLGGFTTFSAFSFETLRLIEDGRQWAALFNVILNVFGSLLAVLIGAVLAKRMWGG